MAISDLTSAISAISGLIMVTPGATIGYQPQNPTNVNVPLRNAILFNYEGENTVTLESDITDHYVEDNTAIQDQIAIRPEQITVQGFIGELNDIVPEILKPLKAAADRLPVIGAYAPGLSATALLAYTNALFLYNVANKSIVGAQASIASISNNDEAVIGNGQIFNENQLNQSKQQIAFQQFYIYQSQRVLFTVQTPWAVFQNMAIKSLRAIQDQDSRMFTDFEITFKSIRFAKTVTKAAIVGDTAQQRNTPQLSTKASSGPDSLASGAALSTKVQ